MRRSWDRAGTTIEPLEGDKVECDTCTLAPACFMAEAGMECRMVNDNAGIWADTFSSGLVDDLDRGLAEVLRLQARRAQKLLDEKPSEDLSYKDKVKHEERIDRNLDRLYKNALAYRNAKAPRPGSTKVIDPEGNEQLPLSASPALMAAAIAELEDIGIPRDNITRSDVLEHLVSQRKIALPAAGDEVF